MKNTTLKEISEVLQSSKYFDEVSDFLAGSTESPAHEVKRIIESDYDDLEEPEKDVFHAWHKHRVLIGENVFKIIPKNTETHTLVTAKGSVCIIRKPIGRVLGQVMSKIGAFNKDPDFYEAGAIILRECRVFMEKHIESDPDELFSIKMACLGATNITETRIKKN